MIRNLGAHPAQLMNPTTSRFWYSSNMVITFLNLKILLSLLLFSHPTVSKFYQPANWNILGLVIRLNFSQRQIDSRKFGSIIITIIIIIIIIIIIHKDIFACLFSIHNIISLSCHEQVCLSGLRFERYFSHHQAR